MARKKKLEEKDTVLDETVLDENGNVKPTDKEIEDEELEDPLEDEEDEEDLDETAAADTITAHNPASKSALLSMTISELSGKSWEDLTKWYHDSIAQSKKSADGAPDTSAKNKASINMKPSGTGSNPKGPFPHVAVAKEDVIAAFDGSELDEDIVLKVATLFESQVNLRVSLEVARIQEEQDAKFATEVETIREELTDKVDQYLDYAAKQWVEENEVAIENSLQVELFNEFREGMRDLFVEHYIDIPEDKVDVLASLAERVEELTEKLNEEAAKTMALQDAKDALEAEKVFRTVAEGLTVTEVEKFKTLVESVDFDGNVEDLTKKLTIVKEANFKGEPKKPAKTGIISEETVIVTGDIDEDGSLEVKKPSQAMANYVSAISRTAKGAV